MESKLREGTSWSGKLEDVLYDFVRCCLLHEGDLSAKVIVTPHLYLGYSNQQFVLSLGLIWGMILAVVACPNNSNEQLPSCYTINVGGHDKELNQLWGRKAEIMH